MCCTHRRCLREEYQQYVRKKEKAPLLAGVLEGFVRGNKSNLRRGCTFCWRNGGEL